MKDKKTKENIRCCALDMNGKRCREKATHEIYYHGDSEIYFQTGVSWGILYVCKKHMEAIK